jgi:hypothetical protein
MKKVEVVERLAEEIGYWTHVGLRKYTDDPRSGDAWKAIYDMEPEEWSHVVRIAAQQIYPWFRKEITKQLKEKKRT